MSQDQTKKEALFNEVKGSLFEYLVGHEIAKLSNSELEFQKSIDQNYLTVLSQQDRMVRQFYPELLLFLKQVSDNTVKELLEYLKFLPTSPRLMGKFSNSSLHSKIQEADLLLKFKDEVLPVSLKLNKKNAFVNTKSGGIKSFFNQYFPFLDSSIQEKFNLRVDLEFNRMALDLHAHHNLEYPGHFGAWTQEGLSELPGELDADSRSILKAYYARIASEMHGIFEEAMALSPELFSQGLTSLMGFSNEKILQVVCFHDFPKNLNPSVQIHSYGDVKGQLPKARLLKFHHISSVELEIGNWTLQVRVKPMNKFTTTAIKINCSVKVT